MHERRRGASICGLAAGTLIFCCYSVWSVPDRAVALFGGATGVERTGGLRVHYRAPPGQEVEIAQRLGVRPPDGDLFVLEYPRLDAGDEPSLRAVLEQGGLRLREVLHDIEYAGALYMRFEKGGEPGAVVSEVDQWTPDDGRRRTDYYLRAPTRQALERAVAQAAADGLTPPPGAELGYELEPAAPPSEEMPQGTPAHWRSYVLRQQVELDGTMIADAEASYAPNTNRAIVLVTLDEPGRQRFCELTKRIMGSKLTIEMGDEIVSAPYINGPICEGRLSVSTKGHDPRQQERQVQDLAAMMKRAPLPRGGRVERIELVPATAQAGVLATARGLLALAGGALAGLLSLGILRWTRPRRTARQRWAGSFPWKRLAITLLGPLALMAGAQLPLPGINSVLLNPPGSKLPPLHATMLGILPVLSAFVFIELIALASPALRWRRHDPRGRIGLSKAVAATALATALIQGWFIAHSLDALHQAFGIPLSLLSQLSVTASLACGTVLLAVVAGAINEHGLGNGYGVLGASSALIGVGQLALDGQLGLEQVPDCLMLAATAALTWAALRWRVASRQDAVPLHIPTSGVTPLLQSEGILLVLGLLNGFGGRSEALAEGTRRLATMQQAPWGALGLTLSLTVLWSWLQARPALLSRPAAAAGLPLPARGDWMRATLLSSVVSATVALLYLAAPGTAELVGAATTMLATATVMDALADARALRAQLVPVAALHQVQHAGIAEHLLASAQIPCHLRGVHLRTLLAFFGPYVPVTVMVPADRGDEARALLEKLSEPRPG